MTTMTKKTCFKLTDKDLRTRYGFQYAQGQRVEVKTYTGVLCSPGVLHAYETAEDAVFFDPIHGGFFNSPGARLWRAEYDGPEVSDGTKIGVGNLTLLEEVTIPSMTTEQRVERGIRAALDVYQEPGFVAWAERWLSGEDRSETAAARAKVAWAATARAAGEACYAVGAAAAVWARAWAAAEAAWAAARAAGEAAEAAEARKIQP
jgi:hypothetical protein